MDLQFTEAHERFRAELKRFIATNLDRPWIEEVRDAKNDDPQESDIHEIGTLGTIVQLVKLPDGTVKVLVEGKRRVRIQGFVEHEDYFQVRAEEIETNDDVDVEIEALIRSVRQSFENYVKLNRKVPPEMVTTVQSIPSTTA